MMRRFAEFGFGFGFGTCTVVEPTADLGGHGQLSAISAMLLRPSCLPPILIVTLHIDNLP